MENEYEDLTHTHTRMYIHILYHTTVRIYRQESARVLATVATVIHTHIYTHTHRGGMYFVHGTTFRNLSRILRARYLNPNPLPRDRQMLDPEDEMSHRVFFQILPPSFEKKRTMFWFEVVLVFNENVLAGQCGTWGEVGTFDSARESNRFVDDPSDPRTREWLHPFVAQVAKFGIPRPWLHSPYEVTMELPVHLNDSFVAVLVVDGDARAVENVEQALKRARINRPVLSTIGLSYSDLHLLEVRNRTARGVSHGQGTSLRPQAKKKTAISHDKK